MTQIDKYSKNHFESFVTLIDECFSIKNTSKHGLVKWKFFSEIFDHKNMTICAYDENKVVWQYSNIAFEFKTKKDIIQWYLCQDMCISKSHRWQKLITKMSSFLNETISSQTFSIWFSNALWVKVDKNSNWYWYKVIDHLKSIYLPILFNKKTSYSYNKIDNYLELEKVDFSHFNNFDNFISINKNLSYLKFRYFLKPNSDYNFYMISNNKIDIWYVVLRYKKWIVTIFDFNFISDISNNDIMNIFNNLTKKYNSYLLKIQLLYNDYWKWFFKWYLKFKSNENIYLTIKNHNWYNKCNNLEKNNWIILTWDIL